MLLFLDSGLSGGKEGLWLLPLLMFFAIGTAWELAGILNNRGAGIRRSVAVLGAAIVSFSAAIPAFWPLFGAVYPSNCPIGRLGWVVLAGFAAIFLALLAEMKDYGRESADGTDEAISKTNSETNRVGAAIERTCAAVFVSLYVGIPMAMLVAIRTIFPGGSGLAALITTIAVTKFTDTGAYFTGRLLGRHKLIPRLSPGKTWEGVVGGILTATIVAFACLYWLFPSPATGPAAAAAAPKFVTTVWGAIILGPTLAVSGIVGDLAESLFKRDGEVKDSGSLLPGLGGVWDVTDSLIAASMPAFLCFSGGVGA